MNINTRSRSPMLGIGEPTLPEQFAAEAANTKANEAERALAVAEGTAMTQSELDAARFNLANAQALAEAARIDAATAREAQEAQVGQASASPSGSMLPLVLAAVGLYLAFK